MNDELTSFSEVKSRLDEIVDEVAREDISLDDALSLYEEAVKLGLGACNLSENDIFPEEIEAVASDDDDLSESPSVGSSVDSSVGLSVEPLMPVSETPM